MQFTQLTLLKELPVPCLHEQMAGVDEVGRGALFGPVVAAAVVLSQDAAIALAELGVTDSKQLSAIQRLELVEAIQSRSLTWALGMASVREIDRLNILRASLLAMKRAILRLTPQPTFCLIDGNQLIPDLPHQQHALVQGDQRSVAIAAASILAKVWRDRLIMRLSHRFPHYDLASNKGYGTPKHRQALLVHGPSAQHRRSFAPCRGSEHGR